MSDFDNRWTADVDGAPEGPATARIEGRLVRADKADDLGKVVDLWVCATDQYRNDDGTFRDAWQAIKVRAETIRLWALTDGCNLVLQRQFHQGRLVLDEIESIEECAEPLPEVRVPKRKVEVLNQADSHLADIADLDKAAKAGGWGSLAHSVYRFAVPVHIVFATKVRSQCLLGPEAMAQLIIRQVVEAEPGHVEVVAVAVENHSGGHVHLVLRHSKPGGTPPTWAWPRFIGRIKALASRRIATLPELDDWPGFHDDYSITAVHGRRQGAEQALAAVEAYVRGQGDQSTEPPA